MACSILWRNCFWIGVCSLSVSRLLQQSLTNTGISVHTSLHPHTAPIPCSQPQMYREYRKPAPSHLSSNCGLQESGHSHPQATGFTICHTSTGREGQSRLSPAALPHASLAQGAGKKIGNMTSNSTYHVSCSSWAHNKTTFPNVPYS